jgi:hypothetical protein
MDAELSQYYETLLDLFASDGWKQYIEDISDNKEVLEDISTINNEQQLWFRRGQLETVQRVLAYESSIKNSYDDFVKDSEDA